MVTTEIALGLVAWCNSGDVKDNIAAVKTVGMRVNRYLKRNGFDTVYFVENSATINYIVDLDSNRPSLQELERIIEAFRTEKLVREAEEYL